MRVSFQSFNNNNYHKYHTAFGSMDFTFGTYRDCHGIKRETQNTTCKRNDICLEDFARVIKWRFRNFDTAFLDNPTFG